MNDQSLNTLVSAYKKVLADGSVQNTYQRLVGVVQNLRTHFSKVFKDQYSVAAVLHGYIDFTYFYLQDAYLKSKKLKLALVLNHQEVRFELWLLGQTKNIQVQYWEMLKNIDWVNEQQMPQWSIFEIPLLDNPDFDNLEKLTETITQRFETLAQDVANVLKHHDFNSGFD